MIWRAWRHRPGLHRRAVLPTLVIGALSLLTSACSIIGGSNGDGDGAASAALTGLAITAPESIGAGEVATVQITADEPDGTIVWISAFGSTTVDQLNVTLSGGTGSATLGHPFTKQSGAVLLVAGNANNAVVHPMTIEPLAPMEPVIALVGPRTIVANGEDFTMATVAPTDRWGNPVADATPVEIRVERENGAASTQTGTVDGGVAAVRISATTTSGRTAISAQSAGSAGPVLTIDEVAGNPADFTVSVASRTYLADGLTTHRVSTSEARDTFGNTLPDGVIVEFMFSGKQGLGVVSSTLQNGRAVAEFVAPELPGPLEISARISGVDADPVVVTFDSALQALPVRTEQRDGEIDVLVGPLVSTLDGWVPDGTAVVIKRQDGSTAATASVDDGRAVVRLGTQRLAPGLTVEVLGVEAEVPDP